MPSGAGRKQRDIVPEAQLGWAADTRHDFWVVSYLACQRASQTTVPLILQTLRTVLSQGVEIQLKILQTLVSLLTNCKDIHNDMLAEVGPTLAHPLLEGQLPREEDPY